MIPPAVAQAGIDTGVARRPIIDMKAYAHSLKARMDPTASILQGIHVRAKLAQARMIFAEGDDPRVLRAAVAYQRAGLGRALVVGREADVKEKLEAAGLVDAVAGHKFLVSRQHPLPVAAAGNDQVSLAFT